MADASARDADDARRGAHDRQAIDLGEGGAQVALARLVRQHDHPDGSLSAPPDPAAALAAPAAPAFVI